MLVLRFVSSSFRFVVKRNTWTCDVTFGAGFEDEEGAHKKYQDALCSNFINQASLWKVFPVAAFTGDGSLARRRILRLLLVIPAT